MKLSPILVWHCLSLFYIFPCKSENANVNQSKKCIQINFSSNNYIKCSEYITTYFIWLWELHSQTMKSKAKYNHSHFLSIQRCVKEARYNRAPHMQNEILGKIRGISIMMIIIIYTSNIAHTYKGHSSNNPVTYM